MPPINPIICIRRGVLLFSTVRSPIWRYVAMGEVSFPVCRNANSRGWGLWPSGVAPDVSQYRTPSAGPIPDFHRRFAGSRASHDKLRAGAKFDHADPLAALDVV